MSDSSKARQVRQFVQALAREDRYIVMLFYADGLTPMEIGRVLDLPSTKVRERLLELRSKLSQATLGGAAGTSATIKTDPAPMSPTRAAYA